jgi:transcriptional regulator NrdR family protein
VSRCGPGLRCPCCGSDRHHVLETRAPHRRRECSDCHTRFWTTEHVDALPVVPEAETIKKDAPDYR